jgi:hypothetical protein
MAVSLLSSWTLAFWKHNKEARIQHATVNKAATRHATREWLARRQETLRKGDQA